MPVLRLLTEPDWPRVAEIWAEGIATGHATFEVEPPTWPEFEASHPAALRQVAEEGGEVVGWVALTPVSTRCVYGGVGEVSVYVSARARRSGVGKALLRALIESSEAQGYWTLQAGIFPENSSSLALFTRAGFRSVGVRERIGQRDGQWRDVCLLERRSPTVGSGSESS